MSEIDYKARGGAIQQPHAKDSNQEAKEGEKTPFHKDAFEVAGGVETPETKGSDMGGWIIQGPGGRQSFCTQLTSPEGIANLMRLRNPAPPQTEIDSGSGGSSSNRFAALQEDEESDATTDIVPTERKQ